MDPVEVNEDDNTPAAATVAAVAARPLIVQLSPIPGNIYDSDRFFYDPAGIPSLGPVGAVVAFAATHGYPVLVHECPNIQDFQAAHPSAIIRPIGEVPPAILARGLSLLAGPSSPVALPATAAPAPDLPAVVPRPLFVPMAPSSSVHASSASKLSSPLLSNESLSRRGGSPSPPSLVARAPMGGTHVPQSLRISASRGARSVPGFAPLRPDPDGVDGTPRFAVGHQFAGYAPSSPHFHRVEFVNHGGSFSFPSTVDARGSTFPGGFLRRFLPTFMVLLGLSHFMGGRLLRLHRWPLHSFRRFRRCVLCLRRTFWAPQPRM